MAPTHTVRFQFSEPTWRGRRPAIFLDRDGVINERIVGGYVISWRDFRFLDGIVLVLRELERLKLPMIVVSNQAGIGKGLMGRSALRDITERFVRAFARQGVRIDAAYYCPHTPNDGCPCRKPRPGLVLQAAREWRLDLGRSVLIGDSPHDVETALAAGSRGLLFDASGEHAGFANTGSEGRVAVVSQLAQIPGQIARFWGGVW